MTESRPREFCKHNIHESHYCGSCNRDIILQSEIKAKDELLRECEESLDQSLRQWEMYANFSKEDMDDRENTEAMLFKAYSKTLQKLREG